MMFAHAQISVVRRERATACNASPHVQQSSGSVIICLGRAPLLPSYGGRNARELFGMRGSGEEAC